jgi:hypothetical protein
MFSNVVQEAAVLRQAHHSTQGELARVQHLLDVERGLLADARADAAAALAEARDAAAGRTRDAGAVAAAEETRRQWEAVQTERAALEAALAARNAEAEQLRAENRRYAGEWGARETSLADAHETRVKALMGELLSRDKASGELHARLATASAALQALRVEHTALQAQLEVRRR